MRDSFKLSMVIWGACLALGCGEKADETVDTTGVTEPETGESAPTTGDEPGMSEGPSGSSAGDETLPGHAEEGDDEGNWIPEDCSVGGEAGGAQFSVVPIDWPEMTDVAHAIDAACVIDAIAEMGDSVEMTLTCDDVGTPRALLLAVDVPDSGAVMWTVGDSVHLKSFRDQDLDFSIDTHSLRLLAADETPLIIAHFGGSEFEPSFEPIAHAPEFPCGPEDAVDGKPGLPFAIRFSLGEESVRIMQDFEDELKIDDQTVFSIVVDRASTNWCCHYLRYYHVLAVRVAL